MTETKPKTKTDPAVYIVHSADWSEVYLYSQKVVAMQNALDAGLKFLVAPFGVDVRKHNPAKTTVTPITPREGNA